MQANMDHVNNISRNVLRKVSFPSPKEKTFYYNPSSSPMRQTRHNDNEEDSKKRNPRKKHTSKKKSQHKIYRIRSRSFADLDIIPLQMVVKEKKGKECNMSVDLGYISPSEIQISRDDEDEIMHTGPNIVLETPIQLQSPLSN